ncbi:MAG TPA: NAD(P)-binding domain-containing protein [Gaiellaceae bacterium]|nr:NAD(P)-binding domain-containing protein [Gaiellaceae bacterium]
MSEQGLRFRSPEPGVRHRARDDRPSPPGDYDVVVVGSGPGGLQTSYCLGRLGVRHAVVSADDGPGGMFRRFPLFERLISWTHAAADVPRDTREYEAHDQNSLVADEPELRGLAAEKLGEGRRRPARDEMEAALAAFAERARLPVRYGCPWLETRREEGRIVLVTADGEYRCRAAVFAVGMTQPWVPPIPGLQLEHHYVRVQNSPERYRDRRVAIVGKRNSAFEIGDALTRFGVRELTLVSPRPPDLGRLARSPLRPWYLTPYDEHVRGAPGRYVLNASVQRIDRTVGGYLVHAVDPTRPEPLLVEADDVIAATGFEAPLRDLTRLGLATVLDGRLPALSPWFESVTLDGFFFAGNVTQAAQGLRKHGVASVSGMVCGLRYNARILARRLAETVCGIEVPRPSVDPDEVVPYVLSELDRAPELVMQKGYLARVLSAAEDGIRDEGILPLEAFVDGASDGVAATLEFDADEEIRPALYVRSGGVLRETLLPPHPLRRYGVLAYREALDDLLRPFVD